MESIGREKDQLNQVTISNSREREMLLDEKHKMEAELSELNT